MAVGRINTLYFTVNEIPAASPGSTIGDYVDDVKGLDVVVVDNDGHSDCTV